MKNKWETARYLIDAKKCVDSLWYISENVNLLKYIDLRRKTNGILTEFYIKCCVVVDEFFSVTNQNKRNLCNSDEIINRVYYERDKNGAHKDEIYIRREYSALKDVVDTVKGELEHIRCICSDCIPDVVTLDYVPYDRELFRFVHHITADIEETIMKRIYPMKETNIDNDSRINFMVFSDTEDYRQIEEEDYTKYGVIINNGICFYEGLQERQDGMIRINLLYNENMWCTFNKQKLEAALELTRKGVFDEFGIIQ